jgi:16S rRNA processing protein RimM
MKSLRRPRTRLKLRAKRRPNNDAHPSPRWGGAGGGVMSRNEATPPSPSPNRRVALAAVAGAHGVKGELRLKLFSDSALSLSRHEKLLVGGVERRLLSIREGGKAATARFAGVEDRSAAESLRGSLVEIDRSALPPLEEGEYYHADLIGLPAVDRDGNGVGTVTAVENYGAGDLLEIALENGKTSLIAFKAGIADLEGDLIVLDPEFLA